MTQNEFTVQAADGVSLSYREWRPDGQEPRALVCLVHGLGDHNGRYAHIAGHLNAAGYAVITFDLRGHGRSAGKRGHSPSYDIMMDDIGMLVAEGETRYAGLPGFLYGHSLGGSLVINYAMRRSPGLRGVIATSPGLRPGRPVPRWKTTAGRLLYGAVPGFQMANGLDMTSLSRDPEVLRAYRADPLMHDRVSARLGLDILRSGEWALEHASEFPLPLLLIHGSADRITSPLASAEFAARAGDCCTFVLLDGFYHETHNDPEAHIVLDEIVGWLEANAA